MTINKKKREMDFFNKLKASFGPHKVDPRKPEQMPTKEERKREAERTKEDNEVLDNLDKRFHEENMDVKEWIKQGLSKQEDTAKWIDQQLKGKKEELSAVTNICHEKVMANYDSFGLFQDSALAFFCRI